MVEAGELDVITFASSSQVSSLVDCLPGRDVPELLKDVIVASIGPITSKTAEEKGLTISVSPDEYTIPGLVDALVQYVKDNPRTTA